MQNREKATEDWNRRYELVKIADAAVLDASQTVESLLRLNLQMQSEILAMMAIKEFVYGN